MRTISQLVVSEIKNQPLIEEGLVRGVINLSALARYLRPRIEKVSLKKTSTGAIVMALQRLGIKLRGKSYNKKLPKIVSFTVQSNLVEYLFDNSPQTYDLQAKIYKLVYDKKLQDRFFNLSQGLFETTLIVSQLVSKDVEGLVSNTHISQKLNNLSAVVIRFGEPTAHLPGVYYPILKALAWEGMNFIEVISVSNELTLVFEDSKIQRAFQVVKELIDNRK